MKYKVVYTAGAKRDLRNIFRYISEELLAPENAAGQTDRIMAAIRKLVTMPNRNRLYEEEPWHSRGLRFFPVDNYLVFYKTNDETETVYIVRIMYRGREVRKQLSRTEDVSENKKLIWNQRFKQLVYEKNRVAAFFMSKRRCSVWDMHVKIYRKQRK